MKCAACGYEKRDTQYHTYQVIRYKSGKNKGEIKEFKPITIEPDKNKEEFEEIEVIKSLCFNAQQGFHNSVATLYVCPECGTVKMNKEVWE